jgi:hypothetical protein
MTVVNLVISNFTAFGPSLITHFPSSTGNYTAAEAEQARTGLLYMLAQCANTYPDGTYGSAGNPVATTAPPPPPTAPPAPVETPGQSNARRSAQQYLSLGHGFSRAGLIEQLSSSYGEGFSIDDATYGVDATNTDWNAQACLSAKSYLTFSAFSHTGLVEQLSSEAGEKFTPDEAEYGVTCAGL